MNTRKPCRRCLPALVLLAMAVSGRDGAAEITSLAGLDMVARLTGANSINHTDLVGIGGTDLGHMVVHQDRSYFLFGDSVSGETPSDGGFWQWNTMAWSADLTPANGILFSGWISDAGGMARRVIYSGYQKPITEIPTAAISFDNRIYAWFMSVSRWGLPGQWTINYAGLAYTEDLGQHFTIVSGFRLPSDTNFGMVAASARTDLPPGEDSYIYVWGTPSGRLGGVKLARVMPPDITNPAAYQYFAGFDSGQPTWTNSEYSAPLIVQPTVGEMSVMYNKAARTWTLLYFNHSRNRIQLRQAYAPWGPWSNEITVVSGEQYPGLYGSYMNPVYVENHGQAVYFTMSLWDPYDVYLMRARFNLASPPCPADLNLDDHVDAIDMEAFLPCMSGPTLPYQSLLTCSAADFDHDGDIDQADFAIIQRCLSGPDLPVDPFCTD